MNPAKNFSKKDSVWSKLPSEWFEKDVYWHDTIDNYFDEKKNPFWHFLKEISESHLFNLFFVSSLSFLIFKLCKFKVPKVYRNYKAAISVFLVGLGLSDFSSSLLKKLFGRTKPHVQNLVPGHEYPLSFPSNHSTNAAFIFCFISLFVLYQNPQILRQKLVYFVLGGLFALSIGFSRIAFGAHYPLDVIAGLTWGTAWGFLYFNILKRAPFS